MQDNQDQSVDDKKVLSMPSKRERAIEKALSNDEVKLIEIGKSGKNYVVSMSKNALTALKEGNSFPIDIIVGDQRMKIILMRDLTFKKQLRALNMLDQQAQDAVAAQELEKETSDLAGDIGKDLD